MEKGSGGHFVLQTPRFWELLIDADNYKGFFDEVSITIVISSYVIKLLTKSFVKIYLQNDIATQQLFRK